MLRAEQLALIQQANQQLLNIRELELNYFCQAFQNLGTISSLLAGFSLAAITSLDAVSFECSEVWRAGFWISVAICMGSSLHCVLTASFTTIFGSGLALRGPTGSMVRAVDGMLAEKESIYNSFIIAICSFMAMTFTLSWVVMKVYAASLCTVILIISSYMWYVLVLRQCNLKYSCLRSVCAFSNLPP